MLDSEYDTTVIWFHNHLKSSTPQTFFRLHLRAIEKQKLRYPQTKQQRKAFCFLAPQKKRSDVIVRDQIHISPKATSWPWMTTPNFPPIRNFLLENGQHVGKLRAGSRIYLSCNLIPGTRSTKYSTRRLQGGAIISAQCPRNFRTVPPIWGTEYCSKYCTAVLLASIVLYCVVLFCIVLYCEVTFAHRTDHTDHTDHPLDL